MKKSFYFIITLMIIALVPGRLVAAEDPQQLWLQPLPKEIMVSEVGSRLNLCSLSNLLSTCKEYSYNLDEFLKEHPQICSFFTPSEHTDLFVRCAQQDCTGKTLSLFIPHENAESAAVRRKIMVFFKYVTDID